MLKTIGRRSGAARTKWDGVGGGGISAEEIKTMKTARKRILVADCHEEVLIVLEKLLEDAGFDTTTVWTAQEALRLVDSQTFDLALINEFLPDAECEDLLRAFHKKGAQVRCIVMQPSAPEITDIRGLHNLGACDVVCKRAYQQVVEAVNKCLACPKPASLVA
jgi:DNA-binding response OmpR family regulator